MQHNPRVPLLILSSVLLAAWAGIGFWSSAAADEASDSPVSIAQAGTATDPAQPGGGDDDDDDGMLLTATPSYTPPPTLTFTPLPPVTATLTPLPTLTFTPVPGATLTPLPTLTYTPIPVTQLPTLTPSPATGTPGATVTPDDYRIIVIEGPVTAININIITIYNFDIELNPADPVLQVIQLGDVIRILGEIRYDDDDDDDGGGTVFIFDNTGRTRINITIINITFVSVTVVIIDGLVWRDPLNCSGIPDWVTRDRAETYYIRCIDRRPPPPSGGNGGGGDSDDDDDDGGGGRGGRGRGGGGNDDDD